MKTVVMLLSTVLASAPVSADDDPQSYDAWFDPLLRAHPHNPKSDVYVEGDTLTVHIDTTRLFPDAVPAYQLGFSAKEALPDVRGVYVAASGAGVKSPIRLQPGLCSAVREAKEVVKTREDELTAAREAAKAAAAAEARARELATEKAKIPATADAATKTTAEAKVATEALEKAKADRAAADAAVVTAGAAVATAKTAVKEARVVEPVDGALACSEALDWTAASGSRGYICGVDKPFAKIIEDDKREWSLVQQVGTKHVCLGDYEFAAPTRAIKNAAIEVIHGQNSPEKIVLSNDRGIWSGSIKLKANTRLLRVSATYEGAGTEIEDDTVKTTSFDIESEARDTHSLVRVQAEVMAANRLRAVSFAVAVTPVRRSFFTTRGPWTPGCYGLLCTIAPFAVLRITGDERTVVQFGGGLGVYLVRAFQVNGGVLFGTADVNSAWRLERNWFVGIAIDPIILADVIANSGSKTK